MTVLNPKVKKQDGEGNGARWAERKPPRDPWRKSRRGNQHGCFSRETRTCEAHLIHKAKTIKPLGMNKRDKE